MYYVIIHIFDEKYLEDIVLSLTSSSIHNALIMNGEVITSYLEAGHISLFTDMVMGEGTRKYSKIIACMVENEKSLNELKKWLKEAEIDEECINMIVMKGEKGL